MNNKQRQKIARKRTRHAAEENERTRVRSRYRIYPVEHSRLGMAALGIAVLMILAFFAMLIYSAMMEGNLPIYFGGLGGLAMAFSVESLITALISRKERRSFKLFPNLAIAASLIASICWIGLFALGTVC